MHVWHQGRKVTGRGPTFDRPYYDYGRHCYVYPRQRPASRPSPTICDAARITTMLASAKGSFRLLDRHGKVAGRRYTRVGPHECGMHLVVDQRGNEDWLDGSARVRIVDRQPEDLMSQASRIISRMHREACREG